MPPPEPITAAPARTIRISEHYTPFPRQAEFHTAPAKYRLFGGAAGPGKTKALLWEAIRQANRYDGVDTLLLRRTFPELESSLVAYFRRDVPREFYKNYNDTKHIVTWLNGSTTRFGHCGHENDVYQYQGAEYLFIGLDELTHFTLKQWQFLTSRNRCPVPNTFPNMAGATNPGNIGHAWVKALWIDRRPPPGMDQAAARQYDPNDYSFTRATVADNPIYADDEEYHRTLDALPTHLRRAFLEGDWDVFAGQYFDVLDLARHSARLTASPVAFVARPRCAGAGPSAIRRDQNIVEDRADDAPGVVARPRSAGAGNSEADAAISSNAPQNSSGRSSVGNFNPGAGLEHPRPYEAGQATNAPRSVFLEPWWPRWISIDWGFEHPSAVLWHTASPDGTIITYREFVQNHLSPRMLAAAIAERCAGERISAIYLSPDAFAQRTNEDTIAEQLARGLDLEHLPRPDPADDERIGGWMLMYELLREDAWIITDNCEQLLETLPTLTRDQQTNLEGVLKCDGDDVADAARYGIKSRLSPRQSDLHGIDAELARRGERLAAEDPTSRAIWMRKLEVESRRRFRPAHAPRRWRV
jgi:hypothetical protein